MPSPYFTFHIVLKQNRRHQKGTILEWQIDRCIEEIADHNIRSILREARPQTCLDRNRCKPTHGVWRRVRQSHQIIQAPRPSSIPAVCQCKRKPSRAIASPVQTHTENRAHHHSRKRKQLGARAARGGARCDTSGYRPRCVPAATCSLLPRGFSPDPDLFPAGQEVAKSHYRSRIENDQRERGICYSRQGSKPHSRQRQKTQCVKKQLRK